MRLRQLGGTVAALALVVGVLVPPAAGAAAAASHDRNPKGSKTSGPTPLIDHGGTVLALSTTYAIWWGPPASFPSDATTGIASLLGGFGGSRYLGIANQYLRGASASSAFGGSIFDGSPPPTHAPSTATIVNEVSRVVATPQANAIYLVYTSNYPHASYCAWHSSGTIRGTTVQVAYVPNTSGVAGCDPLDFTPPANSLSEGTRSMADSTAHEFMEATTDPLPLTGWADKNGQEIGDKCNFTYSAPVTLANGSVWRLQKEWSNADGGCVQGA